MRTGTMDKRLLSQVLDGAAFPAIMLALAVSQIKVGHNHKIGERVQQSAEEYGLNTPTWSPPATEKSVTNKKAAHAE
jgi:hypothetical protein